MPVLDEATAARLYKAAKADRWGVPEARFREALEAGVARAYPDRTPSRAEAQQYLASLHLEDLALASACHAGSDAAWDTLVREYRPALYRAADALDPTGRARELADALHGELFSRSLFRYFHGRSSLATWLRSVLAQRYVDHVRSRKRIDPLADEYDAVAPPQVEDRDVAGHSRLVERTLRDAVARLDPRDRLRLACYYAQQLTLAETGRVMREHEATVSRQLARTRTLLRVEVERGLLQAGLSADDIKRCITTVSQDAGTLDLDRVFASGRKVSNPGSFEGKMRP